MPDFDLSEHLRLAEEQHRAGHDTESARLCQQMVESFNALASHDEQFHVANADLLLGLGMLIFQLGKARQAVVVLQPVVQANPDRADVWYAWGTALHAIGEFAAACNAFEQAWQLAPNDAGAHHSFGQSLFELGQIELAIQHLLRAIELGGGAKSETLLAVICPHSPSFSDEAILQIRQEFARRCLPPLSQRLLPAASGLNETRRLRIGYLSSYFQHANWMKPVWSLINRHVRQAFEIYLFSDAHEPSQEQPFPGYNPNAHDRVFHCKQRSNDELARLIESQALDLLVDLNGYGDARRLGLFMQKPAPILVGWFNTFATTGLTCFDAVIGDATVVLPPEESQYCERVERVPGCYLSFEVNYAVPDVVPPPCCASDRAPGQLTFGSLASLYKMTPQVIEVWARILKLCPLSRLLLKNKGLGATSNVRYMRELFAQQGVPAQQLELEGPAAHFEYLRAYDRIDVALDPFPYTGGTTTSEALWQGVPVLSLTGERWLPRVSASLLKAAGLSEWVMPDVDHYVQTAVELAHSADSWQRLRTLRMTMRDRLRASPLCDVDSFARAMEAIYRKLCGGRND